ncbi:MAG: hypothetical protein Q8O35_11505 [Humidesulfovibrio sp.]|uniref:hypothetical protein n=1 Tax=Humidesulfovibrio sp. TaxID=2910988 RepID=UPI002732B752|nr:hypothetical protein [Humidesulfovibrio sp.]MDP2848799.1 hypothetical protein [Humidesulfovibrio sp.]
MKTVCGIVALTIALSACATVCPPTPANTMSDSPFRNYRLSALAINTTDSPSMPFAQEILDTDPLHGYRPANYSEAETIIRSTFSKPGDEGYASAPAVHVICSMETVSPSMPGFIDHLPAKLVGKVSVIDPGTKRTLANKQCDFDAATLPAPAKDECGKRGLPGLSDVIHQCLRQFAPDMKSARLKPQPTPGAMLEGTFTGVTVNFTPNPPTMWQKATNSQSKRFDDVTLYRLTTYELPTAISKALVDNNPFSNSAANTYSIIIDVKDSELPFEFFSVRKVRYSATTTIQRNGKSVGSFTHAAPQTIVSQRQTAYAGHVQAIVEYLRDHAEEIDKM